MPSRGEEIRHAIERARDHTLEAEARHEALEELRESGALDDPYGDEPPVEHDEIDVEAELEQLKAELATDDSSDGDQS